MRATVEIITAGLARTHPGWRFWTIYPAVGGVLWCAAPDDDSIRPVNATSPEALSAAIRAARKAHMRGDT